MSILSYEQHTDIADPHELLNKFGIFAGTCGWTIDYNLIDCGTWDTGTGTFGVGTQTYLMVTSTGATNGQHAAQVMTYQMWSEHRTGGVSGDQGTILIQGRLNTETKDISDASVKNDHPIWQADWTTSDTDYYRFWFKGAPPKVWFFGNAHFLAMCVDNDGLHMSTFCIGCPETFDKTLPFTDCNFIGMYHAVSTNLEWDTTNSYRGYFYLPFVSNQSAKMFRRADASYVLPDTDRCVWDVFPEWYTSGTSKIGYSVWSKMEYLFDDDSNQGGYKMPYSNTRLLYKPMLWIYNNAGGMIPYGEGPFYWVYITGLSSGAIITQGTKEFIVFHGFNQRDMGIAFRIA